MTQHIHGFFAQPTLALGFRPFFLLAGLFGVVAMLGWSIALTGHGPALGPLWHGHEMLFGYIGAVIAGFVLTAAANWTRRPTLTRAPLAALVLTWLVARVVVALPAAPDALKGVLCAGFFIFLAIGVGRPIVAARSRRNYGVVAVLGVFVALELLYWFVPAMRLQALNATVLFTILLVAVIGGRVIPIFTRNAIKGLRVRPAGLWRDQVSLASLIVLGLFTLIPALPQPLFAAVAILGAVAHTLRMLGWGGQAVFRRPILWVLHTAYAFIPAGLALWAAQSLGVPIPFTVPLHVLTVGALGLMTLGMMTRVSLGHTGRPLIASNMTTLAYALLIAAAVVRGAGPFIDAVSWITVMLIAAGLWSAAFAIFILVYAPMLALPRVDGKPG